MTDRTHILRSDRGSAGVAVYRPSCADLVRNPVVKTQRQSDVFDRVCSKHAHLVASRAGSDEMPRGRSIRHLGRWAQGTMETV